MEQIINNPGLQQNVENIFIHLGFDDLLNCRLINKSCRKMLDNPMFWLKKWIHRKPSQLNYKNWSKAIQITKNSKLLQKRLLYYLKLIVAENIPKSKKSSIFVATFYGYADSGDGWTPIHAAAWYGHADIVKFLANSTNIDVNAADSEGWTPIYFAAMGGHSEVIKILAPLADHDPNIPNKYGSKPIEVAARDGNAEIIRILAPLTKKPNSENKYGQTPIYTAALYGHLEVIKVLAPLVDYPNAPLHHGYTPIDVAASGGHDEIVRILKSKSRKRKRS